MSYPDENALTTLTTLKSYLDPPTSGSTSDNTLTVLITRASNTIVQMLNRPKLITQSVTEIRDGQNNSVMYLRNAPTTAVTSVTIGTTVIPASVSQSNGWVLDADTNTVKLIGYWFTRGSQNVTIVYTAGVATNSQEIGMLEQACLTICALWWKRRAHVDQSSMATPQGIGTINFTQKDIPAEAQTIIDQLKRVNPVF